MKRFDYVIVGAGSSGCVLAARLSEDPHVNVLLLEAGPRNQLLKVRMPLGVAFLVGSKCDQNWAFQSEPEPHLNHRRMFVPRGRGLGGSSAINGMLYVRGHSRDYDDWAEAGLHGWSYEEVLPYFRRSESHVDGPTAYHGGDGPWTISNANISNPLYDAVIEAGLQAGYAATDDFNGAQQEGFGWYDANIRHGRRWSAADAYLYPAESRPNLTIITNAHVCRILLQNSCATGVEFAMGKGGELRRVDAAREVILCAGVIQSPHILQLSGIGDPQCLQAAGIKTVHELPGVGGNLQDHLDVIVGNECTQPVTIYSRLKGARKLKVGLQYLLTGKGMAGESFSKVGAFVRSHEGLDRPNLQLAFLSLVVKDHHPVQKDGYSFHFCQLDPESRGRVTANSPDPLLPPRILFNYLSTEYDKVSLRSAVKIAREIIAQPALTPFRGPELSPGPDVRTDAEIDAWVRQNADSVYHPVGTCKMGIDNDSLAVVDSELRVRGLERLRVVDTSIIPRIPTGNTGAPAVMIAEKAFDMISGRKVLAPQVAQAAAA